MLIFTTQDMFVHELAQLYDAEHRFIECQREMARKVTDEELKGALRNHLAQSEQHARNLEQIFGELGEEPHRDPNEVVKGIIDEAQEDIRNAQSDALRDYLIDSAILKAEHFEMGSYRSLVAGAQQMGQQKIAELLEENMRQEEEAAHIAEETIKKLIVRTR